MKTILIFLFSIVAASAQQFRGDVYYPTNSVNVTVNPQIDMKKVDQSFSTNANFTFGQPLNVPTDATTRQSVCYVSNSSPSLITVNPDPRWHITGTWSVNGGGQTAISVTCHSSTWTNAIASPQF
jgi:hypothetical protein